MSYCVSDHQNTKKKNENKFDRSLKLAIDNYNNSNRLFRDILTITKIDDCCHHTSMVK